MNRLHFKLDSGRVLFLQKPLTPKEEVEAHTPLGMAILEGLADELEKRCTTEIGPEDPRYQALLKKHVE